jgi:hypothetical protein
MIKPNDKDNEQLRGLLGTYESFKTDEEYEESNCMSYSKIKDIHDNPEIITRERTPSKKEWMIFGTLVDMLVNPNIVIGEKVIINDSLPSEQFLKISSYIFDNDLLPNGLVSDVAKFSDDQINQIYSESGSQVNWKPDTKREKVINECGDYLDLLCESRKDNKLVVSSNTYNEATLIAQTLTTHPWTKELFYTKEQQKEKHVELYYQYKIKYIYNNVMCQSKIDILQVDYDLKLISLYDIKTGSDLPREFVKSALLRYKYGYQAVLYNEGFDAFIAKYPAFKEYDLDQFRFVYVSRLRPTYPIIIRLDDACHNEFKEIGVETELYSLPALDELFEEADYYIQKINNGEIVTEPYELQSTWGEVVVTSKRKNYIM